MKNQETIINSKYIKVIYQRIARKQLPEHCHDVFEVIIPIQGNIKIRFEENLFSCDNGRAIFIPPNFNHSFCSKSSGQGERFILLIKHDIWLEKEFISSKIARIVVSPLLKELLYHILDSNSAKNLELYLKAIVASLEEALETSSTQCFKSEEVRSKKIKDDRIKKAYSIIQNEINISVSELAKRSGLSQRNLSRLFFLELGTTPKSFILRKKIEYAKELLITSNLSIKAISEKLGYQSQSRFITSFLKLTKSLPSDFRKKKKK